MSATPSSVDICCSTSISPGDADVSDYFPGMTNPGAARGRGRAASCCYQRGGFIVGTLPPKTGTKFPRSLAAQPQLAVISATKLSCGIRRRNRAGSRTIFDPGVRAACFLLLSRQGGVPAAPAPPLLLLSDRGGVPQRFLLLPRRGVVRSKYFLLLSGSGGAAGGVVAPGANYIGHSC